MAEPNTLVELESAKYQHPAVQQELAALRAGKPIAEHRPWVRSAISVACFSAALAAVWVWVDQNHFAGQRAREAASGIQVNPAVNQLIPGMVSPKPDTDIVVRQGPRRP
jgi:negative regulator of sigma E activity